MAPVTYVPVVVHYVKVLGLGSRTRGERRGRGGEGEEGREDARKNGGNSHTLFLLDLGIVRGRFLRAHTCHVVVNS